MQRIPRRQFTDDFKSQAVSLAESIGPAKAARQLDISVKTLANWVATARISGTPTGISGTPTILGRISEPAPSKRRDLCRDLWDTHHSLHAAARRSLRIVGVPDFTANPGYAVFVDRQYNNLGRIVGVPEFSPAPIFPFPARRVTPCSEWRSAGSMVSAALCRRFSIWFSTWT